MNATKDKSVVLFLCDGNSARSQMAEALLRAKAGDEYEAMSAGMEPKPIHPLTIRVLSELGMDASGLRAKPTSEFRGKVRVKYAIIVCERSEENCPSIFPFALNTIYWPFDDPAAFKGTEADRLEHFRMVRDEIAQRIDQWLSEQEEKP